MLAAATPAAWVDAALAQQDVLLLDHANCEKKAASTAMSLMFAYPDDRSLCSALARLAREELRHFEQVDRMMQKLEVPQRRLGPGRYAGELRRLTSTSEPLRKLDLLLTGALIEARSCERFELLVPRLPETLAQFYGDLARAEARHQGLYRELAESAAGSGGEARVTERLAVLAAREGELATAPDAQFRFHSGPPAAS
jgi:tRNA 2-(methylsulfanyl)-N6-isopentenyladenosine37 hydroxylase